MISIVSVFSAIILANTYFWSGGQGYCAYDFAVLHSGDGYTNVEITLRPRFDPEQTASGRTELDDAVIALEALGGGRFFWSASATVETDCSVEKFALVSATALDEAGAEVDLMKREGFEFEDYKPVDLEIAPDAQ
ncbi:MAG: hypothetical protein AAFY73_07340 [Pseudomonadota bacterium]